MTIEPARPGTRDSVLNLNDADAVRAFIQAHTKALAPPLVPELKLYLAEESLPIWQKTEEQLQQQNIAPPFWAFAWAGGQAIARYLLDHRDIVDGKRVLDIGTGSGIAAIGAMLAGAKEAVATDIDKLSAITAELNADLNGVPLTVSQTDVLDRPAQGCDVYIIADLFYERELAELVLAFARSAKADGATVLVGDPERSYFPQSEFRRLATYEVPVTRELEDALIKKTSVWTM